MSLDQTYSKAGEAVRSPSRLQAEQLRQALDTDGVRGCVIDPRTSRWLPIWDMVTVLSLSYTALVTPYEVAFLQPGLGILFVLNRLVDCIFFIDLVLNFFLAFPAGAHQSTLGAHWVTDRGRIARHYLSGWFIVDLIATATLAFDVLPLIVSRDVNQGHQAGSLSSVTKLKALRVVRVLRLFKLLRLLRGLRVLKRWETRMSVDYGMLSLVQSFVYVVLFAHWSACMWMMQVATRDHLTETWVYHTGYCILPGSNETEITVASSAHVRYSADDVPHGFDSEAQYECMSPFSIYAAAFYWAVMTITSVGYGDIAATAYQWQEQLIASVIMLVGAFVWSNVVATVCGVIATLSPATTDFRLTMQGLNLYMAMNDLPSEMRQRLRDYFHRTRHLWQTKTSLDVLRKMSPALQGEVLLHTNAVWLRQVAWLSAEDPIFLTDVILALRGAVFAPMEIIRTGALHIVHSGVAIYGGRLIRHGGVWGTDVLISAQHLRSRSLVRAITYVEAFFIERDTLLGISQNYSATHERIRRRARLLALQRFIVLIARVSKGLGHHRRSMNASPSALRPQPLTGSLCKGESVRSASGAASMRGGLRRQPSRWRTAWGLYKAHEGAQQSFKRSLFDIRGSEHEKRIAGLRVGTEFDRRVEEAREAKLCNDLFKIAATAASSSSSNLLGTASCAKSTRDEPSAPNAALAEGVPSVMSVVGSSPTKNGHGGGSASPIAFSASASVLAAACGMGCDAGGSEEASKEHPGKLRHATFEDSVLSCARSQQTKQPHRNAEESPDARPVTEEGSGKSSSLTMSFLKRRRAARDKSQQRQDASPSDDHHRRAHETGSATANDEAKHRAGRSRRGLSSGIAALHVRMDDLAASNESVCRELGRLAGCIAALQPAAQQQGQSTCCNTDRLQNLLEA